MRADAEAYPRIAEAYRKTQKSENGSTPVVDLGRGLAYIPTKTISQSISCVLLSGTGQDEDRLGGGRWLVVDRRRESCKESLRLHLSKVHENKQKLISIGASQHLVEELEKPLRSRAGRQAEIWDSPRSEF